MSKADPALVEQVLNAARAAIADPELRAKLVPEAVDDVDEAHLRLRAELFGKMPGLQRMVLGVHAAKAQRGTPLPGSPQRDAWIASIRSLAGRYCADAGAVDGLVAVADRIDDAGLAALEADLQKLLKVTAMDLQVLLDMDARAERSAARAAGQGEAAQARATSMAEKRARLEQMRAELDAKLAALKAKRGGA